MTGVGPTAERKRPLIELPSRLKNLISNFISPLVIKQNDKYLDRRLERPLVAAACQDGLFPCHANEKRKKYLAPEDGDISGI